MTITLRPYPAYKDSGMEWLGKVPEHWQILSNRRLFHETTRKYVPDQNGVVHLSLSQRHGLIPVDQLKEKTLRTESYEKFKVCLPDDLILNRFKAHLGVFFASKTIGIVTFHYGVFRPIIPLVTDYYEILFHTPAYKTIFAGASNGMTVGLQNLSNNNFYQVRSIVPSLAEQASIVKFVRWIEQNCRRLIRAKRRLIALLNEQKQAIIHRAVTRGLDPNVRLKASGVPWLGEVPEHWEVAALRRYWRVIDCKHLTVPFVPEGIPLASVREAQSFDLCLDKANRTTLPWYKKLIEGGRKPRRGDLIYCRNVSVGAATYVDTDEPFAMGQDVCRITSRDQNQRWLNYFLHSKAMEDQLTVILVGSTFHRINVADIKALFVTVPPRSEQNHIVEHLDKSLATLQRTIRNCMREQEMVREYRTRLITDVVTGKLDVRGIEIPDVLEELEGDVEEEDAAPSEDLEGSLDDEMVEMEES